MPKVLGRLVEGGLEWFVSLLMGTMLVLGFYQVLARTVLGDSPAWIVEAIGIMFIYAVLIAAGLGVKKGIHIGVDIFVGLLPSRPRTIVKGFGIVCEIVFGIVFSYVGLHMVLSNVSNLTPVMRVSNSYVYFGFVLGGVVFTVNSIISLCMLGKENSGSGGEINAGNIIN
jgi:C4-dicarboxylate transporter DctQ subunit